MSVMRLESDGSQPRVLVERGNHTVHDVRVIDENWGVGGVSSSEPQNTVDPGLLCVHPVISQPGDVVWPAVFSPRDVNNLERKPEMLPWVSSSPSLSTPQLPGHQD